MNHKNENQNRSKAEVTMTVKKVQFFKLIRDISFNLDVINIICEWSKMFNMLKL